MIGTKNMDFKIEEITSDSKTKEKYVTIVISNSDIKTIKSAITWYEGDKDDIDYKQKMEKLRENIHQTWRQLNPS